MLVDKGMYKVWQTSPMKPDILTDDKSPQGRRRDNMVVGKNKLSAIRWFTGLTVNGSALAARVVHRTCAKVGDIQGLCKDHLRISRQDGQ